MICGKLRNLLTTSISLLTKFTECFMVYCFPSKAPSQESNPETRAYTTGLLLRAVRFRLVGPVYSQFQSLSWVQIDRHQCSRLPYIYHWKRTYRTLWFGQKSQYLLCMETNGSGNEKALCLSLSPMRRCICSGVFADGFGCPTPIVSKKSRSCRDVVVMCWTQILGLQVL